MGILSLLVKELLACLWHRRSLKSVYPIITNRVESVLKNSFWKEYGTPEIANNSSSIDNRKLVWFCWLQGMVDAPEMERKCLEFICRYLLDYDVVVIDEKTYNEYVELPAFIEEKYRKALSLVHCSLTCCG